MIVMLNGDTLDAIVFGGTISGTGPCHAYVSYRDLTADGYVPGRHVFTWTAAAAAPGTIMNGPASGVQRVIDYISISLGGFTTMGGTSLTVSLNTDTKLFVGYPQPGSRVEYTDRDGWSSQTLNGEQRLSPSAAISAFEGWNTVNLASDVVNNNATANTIADVTGLSFPVVAGQRYTFLFALHHTADSTATGVRFSINGPTADEMCFRTIAPLSGGTNKQPREGNTAYDFPTSINGTNLASGGIAYVEGYLAAAASGDVVARFASGTSGGAVTVLAGSFCRWGLL